MATRIEKRSIELSLRNPHDNRELAIAVEQGKGYITIKILDGLQDLVINAPNILVLNDTIETVTITYNKEIEVPA